MSGNIDSLLEYLNKDGHKKGDIMKKVESFLCVQGHGSSDMVRWNLTILIVKAMKDDDDVQVKKLLDLADFLSAKSRLVVRYCDMVIPHGKDHQIERCLKMEAVLGWTQPEVLLTYVLRAYSSSLELAQRVIDIVYGLSYDTSMNVIVSYFRSIDFDIELGCLLVLSSGTRLSPMFRVMKKLFTGGNWPKSEIRKRIMRVDVMRARRILERYDLGKCDHEELKKDIVMFYHYPRAIAIEDEAYADVMASIIKSYIRDPYDEWSVYLDIADVGNIDYIPIVSKSGSDDLLERCLRRDSIDYTKCLRAIHTDGCEVRVMKIMRDIGVDLSTSLDQTDTGESPMILRAIDVSNDPGEIDKPQ